MKYAEFTEEQKEKARVACRKWRAGHREDSRAATKRWEVANVDYVRVKRKEYCAANRVRRTQLKREWLNRNPGYELYRKYNITWETFLELSEAQFNKCLICNKPAPLCVDHCHKTNRIRGLLCHKCNSAVGLLGDDFSTIIRAADYIRRASYVQS